MLKLSIRPQWQLIKGSDVHALPRLLELLHAVDIDGGDAAVDVYRVQQFQQPGQRVDVASLDELPLRSDGKFQHLLPRLAGRIMSGKTYVRYRLLHIVRRKRGCYGSSPVQDKQQLQRGGRQDAIPATSPQDINGSIRGIHG